MFFSAYFKVKRGNNKRGNKEDKRTGEKTGEKNTGAKGVLRGGKGSLGRSLTVIICASVALVCVSVALGVTRVPDKAYCESLGEYSLCASSGGERERFLSTAGYRAEQISVRQIRISSTGESFREYNEVLRSCGLDLTRYSGRTADEYIYKLYKKDGEPVGLYAVMTVYKGRVIAIYMTDLEASADEAAKMKPFKKAD